ncbi:S-layer homology domain-containing protein [Candidatus Peregrinibacteria bacterium]|nr:MAG: S-layer homology domain-containing protein [Candidatus Peregrinibacteria bacterium]
MSLSSSSVRKWLCIFLSISFVCATGLGVVAEKGSAEESGNGTEVSNILLQQVGGTKSEVNSLPVRLTEFPRNLDNTDLQMPQEGEYIGTITRETSVYDEKHAFSVLYPLSTTVTLLNSEEPFSGIINAPKAIFPSQLPTPKPINARFLGGAVLSAEEKIMFHPSVFLRYPIGEQQKGNTAITVYWFHEEDGTYQSVPYEFSEDGEGVLIKIVQNGIYAIYDGPGELPSEEVKEEAVAQETSQETFPSEEKREESDIPVKTNHSSYRDIAQHWAKAYIEQFASAGLSFSENTSFFFPDAPATRSEVVRILVQSLNATDETKTCLDELMPSHNAVVFFTDIRQNHANADFLCVASQKKLISGRADGSFGPDDAVSRAEALSLLYRVSKNQPEITDEASSSLSFEDVPQESWFAPFVARAISDGVATGFTEYDGGALRINAEQIGGGETGTHVEELQRILTELDFFSGEINGIFTEELRNAVLQYQLSRGILQTPNNPSAGVVGPATIATINGELGARNVGMKTKTVFRPNAPVTHAEVAKFASVILGFKE